MNTFHGTTPADEWPRPFRTIDAELTGRDPRYAYDVDAGLPRLHRALAERSAPAARPSRFGAHGPHGLGTGPARRTGPASRAVDERHARLVVTALTITSRISPEVARRLADGLHGQRWVVSWLPERVCTRAQALAAMVLDEILTDPGELDSAAIMQVVHELARELGLPPHEALVRLSAIKNRLG